MQFAVLPIGIIPSRGSHAPFPLQSTVIHYEVVDVNVVANLVQTYVSTATEPVQVNYFFPLPPDAAVCSFKAVIDEEKVIKGVVKEKHVAKQEYDQAVRDGRSAALLEQKHSDVFQVSLGNLEPGQVIEVHISFVSLIAHDGTSPNSLRLMIPATIAPRYGASPLMLPPQPGHLLRGRPLPTKSQLRVTLSIQMTGNISSINSPTHPIALTLGTGSPSPAADYDPTKAHVLLESDEFLEKDIVVVLVAQNLDRPRCSVEHEGQSGTDAYALTFVPHFDVPALPSQNYIFLIDRSGSMDGSRIKAVRTAMQIMLRSLPTKGTTFNIWSFGTAFSSLWSESKIYSARTVQEAEAHIDSLTANYGGTEINRALTAVFSSLETPTEDKPPSVPVSLFVLTDGEAWDLDSVFATVRDASAKAKANNNLLRAFVLGVGDGVSTPMCNGIARAGKGIAVFVGNNEKPDAKLMGLLKATRGGVIEDLAVDWGVEPDVHDDFEIVEVDDGPQSQPATPLNLFDETPPAQSMEVALGPGKVNLPPPPRIQQAPPIDKLPIPLYPGFRCSLFAVIKRNKNDPAPGSVKITGNILGRPIILEVSVTKATPSSLRDLDNEIHHLHILAARALIQVIEDLPKSDENDAKIVRLATQYSLASSQTSFVAIDDHRASTGVEGPVVTVSDDALAFPVSAIGGGRGGRRTKQTARKSTGGKAPRMQLAAAPQMGQMQAQGIQQMQFAQQVQAQQRLQSHAIQMQQMAQMQAQMGQPMQQMQQMLAQMTQPMQQTQHSMALAPAEVSIDPQLMQSYSMELSQAFSAPLPDEDEDLEASSSAPKKKRKSDRDMERGALTAGDAGASFPKRARSDSQAPTLESLIRQQDFEGYFSNQALQGVISPSATKPTSLSSIPNINSDNIWTTVIVLVYLAKKFADEKESWDFVAQKGWDYIHHILEDAGFTTAASAIEEWRAAAVSALV